MDWKGRFGGGRSRCSCIIYEDHRSFSRPNGSFLPRFRPFLPLQPYRSQVPLSPRITWRHVGSVRRSQDEPEDWIGRWRRGRQATSLRSQPSSFKETQVVPSTLLGSLHRQGPHHSFRRRRRLSRTRSLSRSRYSSSHFPLERLSWNPWCLHSPSSRLGRRCSYYYRYPCRRSHRFPQRLAKRTSISETQVSLFSSSPVDGPYFDWHWTTLTVRKRKHETSRSSEVVPRNSCQSTTFSLETSFSSNPEKSFPSMESSSPVTTFAATSLELLVNPMPSGKPRSKRFKKEVKAWKRSIVSSSPVQRSSKVSVDTSSPVSVGTRSTVELWCVSFLSFFSILLRNSRWLGRFLPNSPPRRRSRYSSPDQTQSPRRTHRQTRFPRWSHPLRRAHDSFLRWP